MTSFIHPSASVEDKVMIGDNTKIWQLCQVRSNAVIGSECILGRGVFVDAGVNIGNRVKIQNYVSVYAGVTLGNGVFVGPHVCFTNDLYPRAVNADMTLKSPDDWTITPTHVLDGASIGANSTIVCGITIGRWAMIGAGSTVSKSVPDYTLVVGNPARLIGFVCAGGHRHPTLESAVHCELHQ
jgi:UDP-2-acetamido-3-amino-2,3-dideoxy-glucuronate N-acetyltransferase